METGNLGLLAFWAPRPIDKAHVNIFEMSRLTIKISFTDILYLEDFAAYPSGWSYVVNGFWYATHHGSPKHTGSIYDLNMI